MSSKDDGDKKNPPVDVDEHDEGEEDNVDGEVSGSPPPPPPPPPSSSHQGMTETEAAIVELLKNQASLGTASAAGSGAAAASASDGTNTAALSQIQAAQLMSIKREGKRAVAAAAAGGGGGKGGGDGERKAHAFWDTQPMPHERMGTSPSNDGTTASGNLPSTTSTTTTEQHVPIVPNKAKSDLRQTPYNMPKGFQWSDVDITSATERKEVYDLLALNYVEDDDCMFRFDYSENFLTWALTPPGFTKVFHLGVRSTKSNRLMAFITGVPATIRAYEREVPMVEINFLCVHKKLRSKRLAPVLIKEITRRVNHTGVFQAVYTAGVVLPVPVASCRYFHRSLDPKKLVEVGFSRLQPRMTMARMVKLYRLPTETSTPGLRPMEPRDVSGVHLLLTEYLKKFSLAVSFTPDELAHWLLPREGVVNSYVATNPDTGTVTDLCSFYHLPSTIIGHPKHSKLRAAYSFYNVATTVELKDLMKDCLILAKREGQDVFNALNLMENDEFLSELKFGVGDGNLQYYLYNWSCPVMESKDVGIVLL